VVKVEGACPKMWEFKQGGNVTGITSIHVSKMSKPKAVDLFRASLGTEVVAKSLESRLQWTQQQCYRAFRLLPRYNLASSRVLRLPSGTLRRTRLKV
jgi:hypothetical protein